MELSKTKPISYGTLRVFLGQQWCEETLDFKEEVIQDAVKRVWNDFKDDDVYEIQFEVKYSRSHYGKHIFYIKGFNISEKHDEMKTNPEFEYAVLDSVEWSFDSYEFKYDAEMHCIFIS